MPDFKVSRAHLKTACDQKNWDLLDKLLEIDASQINDNALYTDTWGLWWGLLHETVMNNAIDGVRVLLKHGAERSICSCGDGYLATAFEIAEDKPEITALLLDSRTPDYVRKTEPDLPASESPDEQAINRQGEIREHSGLLFQIAVDNPNLE